MTKTKIIAMYLPQFHVTPENNKWWGEGLGTGGNAALTFGAIDASSWFATGGETQLMSFMYQIGVQGVLAFIICVLSTSLSTKFKLKKGDEIFIIIPLVLLMLSLLQDNTFTPQCVALFMIMQGGMKRIYSEKQAS